MNSNVLVIIGTRPEAIKLAPIIMELKKKHNPIVMCTGQHTNMVTDVLNLFNITPDVMFDLVGSQPMSSKTGTIMNLITEKLKLYNPKTIIVQGDTISALAGAMVGYLSRIPVCHVEAGLRSEDMNNPYPEEMARRTISLQTTLHFPPTQLNYQNLINEGIKPEYCHTVGNTVVDALFHVRDSIKVNTQHKDLVLITAHRRENWGKPIENVCSAINKLSDAYPQINFCFFTHPNPVVQKTVLETIESKPNVMLFQSVPYNVLIKYMVQSKLIITDSGGIQEEATILGIPTLVTREKTERQEGLSHTLKLVGTDINTIVDNSSYFLNSSVEYKPSTVFGDGKSSERIVRIIDEKLLK